MSTATTAAPRRRFLGNREQTGWYFYDWANSAFSTTVVSVFLGPYLTDIAETAAGPGGFIYPLGIPVRADAYFPYLVSISVLLQVLILPVMGAVVDYTHLKKRAMAVFAYIGAFATMGLYLVGGEGYLLGGLLFLVANVSFGAAMVAYNAFLPDIADANDRDRVSSIGWALGYLGGGLLLAMNLVFYSQRESLGVSTGQAVRLSLASAGLWWALFTLIPLLTLVNRQPRRQLPPGGHYVTVGFKQLGHTLRKLPGYPQTLLFLVAYLLYNDGIQTVIALSAQFGSEELGMPTDSLILLILMVQFVAFFGALAFGLLARWLGAKRSILVSLVIWTGVTVYTFAMLQTVGQFFVVGAVIAVVLGGSQALSRSLFSQMIPRGQETEYFSLYEVSERGTSWLGPLVFGLAIQFSGSYRLAVLLIGLFFVAGIVLLPLVNVRKAIVQAGNEVPNKV
jgi:UMF1 family MFS transporter